MRIGIFDSGVGGLIIAKAIRKAMPEYDYVYLGDTKRVPYGNRSHEVVYEFTREGVDYLFKKENCVIVIIACNTASAKALRRIQQEYLVKNFPHRRVLGVLVPTAEECAKYKKVGIIGTNGTISSDSFVCEISKINPKIKIVKNPAPMLVPLVEEGERALALPFIKKYLKIFDGKKIEALALGCTHYPFYKNEIRKILGKDVRVISQDEIILDKLKEYFIRHPEITKKLTRNKKARILVTDLTKNVERLTKKWFGEKTKAELVHL